MKPILKWMGVSCAVAVAAGIFVISPWGNAHQRTAGNSIQVKIDNFTFAPPTLRISPGTTVEWVNRDDIPHTVVSDDQSSFKSRALDTDDKFSHTFAKPGNYSYFCSIHPKMTGKVVVQ